MKTRRWCIGIVLLALMAAPSVARAQEATPAAVQKAGTVTVLGRGTVSVKPDTAAVQIGITTQQATLSNALDEANTKMSAIIDALAKLGIADEDIQTAYFSVSAVRDTSTQTGNELPPVVGYSVSNQVNATLRDLKWKRGMPSGRIGEVIGAAIDAGATDIYGIAFSVSNTKDAEQTARTMAVANANERGTELAAAAGKRLGEVLGISEGVTYQPLGAGQMQAAGQGAGGPPIVGGTVDVVIEVTVTYELV
jgi:uncharacterized protein YggE